MRRAALVALSAVMTLGPVAPARADVLRFHGEARIDLHERVDHVDSNVVETTAVELDIELHGARPIGYTSEFALGSATIRRDDGSTTTIALSASMYPPEGSGGFVHATGLGDDGSLHCFRIWDLADAPSQRPDRLVAGFEPAGRFGEGFAGSPNSVAIADICMTLDYLMSPPHSGDFSFSTTL